MLVLSWICVGLINGVILEFFWANFGVMLN